MKTMAIRRGRSARCAGLLMFAVLMTAAATAQEAESLARYVPAGEPFAVLEFEGLDADRDAWERTATYRLLHETPLGDLLVDLARQAGERYSELEGAPPMEIEGREFTTDQVVGAAEYLLREGAIVALWGDPQPEPDFVIVARGVAAADADPIVKMLAEGILDSDDAGVRSETRAGRAIRVNEEGIGLWEEAGDLIFTSAIDAVMATIDGDAPSLEGSDLLAGLGSEAADFVPVLRGFVDLKALPPLPPEAAEMGLDAVERVELLWGFQGEALRSELRVVAPGPRRGVLALFDQPTFGMDTLPPMPPGLTGFTVVSLDLEKTYDTILEIARRADPGNAEQFAAVEQMFRQQLGIDLREQLLKQLGPKIAVHLRPEQGAKLNIGAMMPPDVPQELTGMIAGMYSAIGGLTILAEVKDRAQVADALDKLVNVANAALSQAGGPQGGRGPKIVKKEGQYPSYTFEMPAGMIPPGMVEDFAPTIILGKSNLVLAMNEELARSAGGAWVATGEFEPMAERLPGDMFFLNVSDPRESVPELISQLPELLATVDQFVASESPDGKGLGITIDRSKLPDPAKVRELLFPNAVTMTTNDEGLSIISRESVPSAGSPAAAGAVIAMLLPAVQSGREAARRSQCINNLKQMALAFHNYHSAMDEFPSAITDADGTPLLSWRVAILPYIEQQDLYNEFHLDEAWDSPHNKALIARMPAVYACPSDPSSGPGETHYRATVGEGGLFREPGQPTGIREITDGTSNTILVAEATEGVEWTKPEGLPVQAGPDTPVPSYGSKHPGGFNAAFCDGSVRFLKLTIDQKTLHALLTPRGGEVIRADDF